MSQFRQLFLCLLRGVSIWCFWCCTRCKIFSCHSPGCRYSCRSCFQISRQKTYHHSYPHGIVFFSVTSTSCGRDSLSSKRDRLRCGKACLRCDRKSRISSRCRGNRSWGGHLSGGRATITVSYFFLIWLEVLGLVPSLLSWSSIGSVM